MTPRRIQMTRNKPWQTTPAAISVARGTRFGNPFVVGQRVPHYPNGLIVRDARHATELYRDWLLRSNPADFDQYEINGRTYNRREVLRQMWRLVGHDLACWCPPGEPGPQPDACHGDYLLWLSNAADALTTPAPTPEGNTP